MCYDWRMEDLTGKDQLEFSEWGAPMTHDGTLPTEQTIFVDAVDDITEDGWEFLQNTRHINWVIIPLRTS